MKRKLESGQESYWNACRKRKCPHALLFSHLMRFLELNHGVIWKALELIRGYHLFPRDAMHAATAFIAGAQTIFSEDTDFDNIPGL